MGTVMPVGYRRFMAARTPVGDLLREWRQRRRKSQLALACDADISTRHLSFIETGRAQPSREMLLHLAERLDVPLRERNVLLTAAGFAPMFEARPLDDPTLGAARQAVDWILAGHEPFPALAIDAHWNLLAANRALAPLLAGVDAKLLAPPVNVLRLSLHPEGLAPRVVNLAEWRTHLLVRLQRQIDVTADPVLIALAGELRSYPTPIGVGTRIGARESEQARVAVPFKLRTERGVLSLLGTTTVFGTPVDITLAELALESFFPADAATAAALRDAASQYASQ
jgi:transcriptional regulator with XRE-family HTH domain